jgi:hypothetical protein
MLVKTKSKSKNGDTLMEYNLRNEETDLQDVMSVCGAMPKGDELPQVAGVNDIVADVYSDVLNITREHAACLMHHQFEDDLDYDDMIH